MTKDFVFASCNATLAKTSFVVGLAPACDDISTPARMTQRSVPLPSVTKVYLSCAPRGEVMRRGMMIQKQGRRLRAVLRRCRHEAIRFESEQVRADVIAAELSRVNVNVTVALLAPGDVVDDVMKVGSLGAETISLESNSVAGSLQQWRSRKCALNVVLSQLSVTHAQFDKDDACHIVSEIEDLSCE